MSIRRLFITTNVDSGGTAAGDVGYLLWMSPGRAGAFREYSLTMQDMWKLGNVVCDAEHADFSYSGAYGSNTATLTDALDNTSGKYIKRFEWNFSGNPSGYAGIYFGPASDSSSGTTGLNFEFYSAYAGTIKFTAKDNALVSHICTKTITVGWQTISIPWIGAIGTGFSQTTFTHPVSSFNIDAVSAMNVGTIMLDQMRYDSIITMANLTPGIINGMQFAIEPVNAGTDDYLFHINRIKINNVIVDGTALEPDKYKGIPRWTYKWMMAGQEAAYGSWRGPSAVGYSWLAGWTESSIVNPDNGLVLSSAMLQFMYDSQQAYKAQFPAKQIGPFAPRFGRPSWEALNTGGYVAGVYTTNTYGKWYWPDTDDWYGYTMRALAAVAQHYYLTGSAQAKTILDNWMAWLDVYIIADGLYWKPPSEYNNDGTVGYSYKPVYAYAMIAQACIYKYWVDGDALALKWYRRMLDTIYATKRLTGTGTLLGCSRTTEGSGYTSAVVIFSVNSGATAPNVSTVIAGGKVRRYTVTSAGLNINSISAVVSGDGAGATCTPYLSDQLVGAFDDNHTGWELPEIFTAYAMLVNGSKPGGTVNYPTSVTATDSVAFVGLIDLYQRNTSGARPSLLNSYGIPLHEWDIDPSHNSKDIENPMVRDTHARGALWTETLAPTMYAAVEYGRYSGNYAWLESLYALAREYTGLSGGSTHLTPTPRPSTGLMDAYTDIIGGEPLTINKRGSLDAAVFTVATGQKLIIPSSAGGGDVTWVRGAWQQAVPFDWDDFMSDVASYGGDSRNYADVNSGATASNIYSGGVLSTVIQLSSIAVGDIMQVYYSHRNGTVTSPGQSISGWPNLHVDAFQGTANDGDNYMMMSLYHAWRSTGIAKYKDMADRIGYALLDAGRWEGNEVQFNLPFESEAAQFGIFSYHGSNTPLLLDVTTIPNANLENALRVRATVLTAQTPANYAGFGLWPSWQVTSTEPFSSFDFGVLWFGAGAYSEISYLAQQENVMWERQFLIGTSDYSSKVVRWPTISKVWNEINPKTVTIELSNEDRTFNFLAADPTKMRNDVTLSLGFEFASMLTMFEGTIDAVRYNRGGCSLTLVDKLRRLTDRKIGDNTTPVAYTSSSYLVHDLAWYAMTSHGGLSAVTNSSNPDIDYLSYSSWSAAFSIDNVRVQAHLTGQPPLDILRRLSQLTQSAIYDENGKIKFTRFTLATSPTITIADSGTLDTQATLDDRLLVNRAAVSAAYNVTSRSFGITVLDIASDSQASYGLREDMVAENYVWLTDSVSALNLAQRMIVTNKNMQNRYSISTPLTTIGVEVGDAVVYQDAFLQVDDTFRVMGMSTDMHTGKKTLDIDRSQYFTAFTLDVSTLDSAAVLT